jgi:uncharacterized protein
MTNERKKMTYELIRQKMLGELKEKCFSPSNKFGSNIWEHHMLPVIHYSRLMAKELEADYEIVELGAILHDYASVKDYSLYKEHHIHGAEEAEVLLLRYDYPKEKIDHVKNCIYEHRGSVKVRQMTKESVCVASGDAMSHIANVPSLLHLAYTTKGMSIEQGSRWVKDKIERSWNKLCIEAKEIIRTKYESALETLDGLEDEEIERNAIG